jgi:hypothetical protein
MESMENEIEQESPSPKGKRGRPAAAAKEGERTIHIVPPRPVTLRLRLYGDSILVVHAFSEKAKREMRDKQQKNAKKAREAKDPVAEYNGARYLTRYHDGRMVDAFPAMTIKKSLVSACRLLDGIPMTLVKQTVFVNRSVELVPIEREPGVPYFGEYGTTYAPPMREDIVRVNGRAGPGSGTADLRYRPEYSPWTIPIEVMFLPNIITPEQIVNLISYAGMGAGVGENRPEKTGGSWGIYRVSDDTFRAAAEAE